MVAGAKFCASCGTPAATPPGQADGETAQTQTTQAEAEPGQTPPIPGQPRQASGPARPTSKPSQPHKPNWFDRHRVITSIGLVIGAIIVISAIGSAGGSSAKPYGPKVYGDVNNSLFAAAAGDASALHAMHASNTWCQWIGDHVHEHITLRNTLGAHVTVQISPSYDLKNAGTHGDGALDQKSAGVNSKATRQWDGDLGHPSGVGGRPAITSCSATVEEVDLG